MSGESLAADARRKPCAPAGSTSIGVSPSFRHGIQRHQREETPDQNSLIPPADVALHDP
jgi:hypothetical protein